MARSFISLAPLVVGVVVVVAVGPVAGAAAPQWGADPAVNQVISSAPSDQNQPKLAPTPDGGYWVSWLDGIGTGWDVRLQKLDAGGVAAFGAGGILVADRSFSSTQDYGLSVAANGDALLAFRDDRSGGVKITAARVSDTGVFAWGPGGVTLSSGSGFVAAPKVVQSALGSAAQTVVAWTDNSSVRVQAVGASGQLLWGSGTSLVPPVGSYALADLERVGEDVVVSAVYQTGGFTSPRRLVAQRLDPSGGPLWGAAPVSVFGAGSLQIGNYPGFVVDGEETVFAWYTSSPSLQCYAQRLDGAGAPRFGSNGVAVATAAGDRVNPQVAVDPVNGDSLVVWRQQVPNSSLSGISAQRFNVNGARLWGSGGLAIAPVAPNGADFPSLFVPGSGAGAGAAEPTLFTWLEAPSFGADRIYGASFSAAGAIVTPRFDVASTPSIKSRLGGAVAETGLGLLAWSDERSDSGDILVQALGLTGTLGGAGLFQTAVCTGAVNSTGGPASLLAHGSAEVASNDLTVLATALPAMAAGFFITSTTAALVPNPGGSAGTLCLGGSIGRYVGPGQILFSGPAGVFSLQLDLTQVPTPTGPVPALAGETRFFQAWYRDANPTNTSNFTSALEVQFQ